MIEQTFFMVWNPSRSAPTHKHLFYDLACKEAERLSRNAPGETFFVLQALTSIRKVDVERNTLKGAESIVHDIELPF